MNLDEFANIADILAIPLTLVGLTLVLQQLYLARRESEREHKHTRNEMTLNAYSSVRKDLGALTSKVWKKMNINDMFDNVTEEQIEIIMNDKSLRHNVEEILNMLNKFAVGVKYDVFNIDMINDLSGKFLIKTHKQFKPYIRHLRKNSNTFYAEYDQLVIQLKRMHGYKDVMPTATSPLEIERPSLSPHLRPTPQFGLSIDLLTAPLKGA